MASSCLTNSHHAVQERGSKLTHSGTCSMFCSEQSKCLINRTWILWSLLFTLNDLIVRFSRSSDTQCFLAGRHALSDWASYCGPESKCWGGGSIYTTATGKRYIGEPLLAALAFPICFFPFLALHSPFPTPSPLLFWHQHTSKHSGSQYGQRTTIMPFCIDKKKKKTQCTQSGW